MSKFYNTQADFASNIVLFLKKVFPNIRKTQLNIIPFIVLGMILSESSVTSDIAKSLKGDFSLIQFDSVCKRIRRFFNNKLFNPYFFYDSIIKFVISNYKLKHSDNRIHIIIDHMFSKNNYSILMFSLRVGKQSIPLWFRCFKGKYNKDAFQEDLIIDGVSFVSSLFPSYYNIIFLADRWFNSTSLMKYIDSLGHTFCFRFRKNNKILIFDKKEGHDIWKWADSLFSYKYHSNFIYNIPITENLFLVNIAISKNINTDDPWIIVTNGDPLRAIKDYSYRFGGIECLFKNQKSNGFYLENVCNASIKAFSSLYSLICFSSLFLTILGTEYSKNKSCYKNINITTHKTINGKKVRVLSLFNTGLTLFHLAFNSLKYIRIPFRFILYDI